MSDVTEKDDYRLALQLWDQARESLIPATRGNAKKRSHMGREIAYWQEDAHRLKAKYDSKPAAHWYHQPGEDGTGQRIVLSKALMCAYETLFAHSAMAGRMPNTDEKHHYDLALKLHHKARGALSSTALAAWQGNVDFLNDKYLSEPPGHWYHHRGWGDDGQMFVLSEALKRAYNNLLGEPAARAAFGCVPGAWPRGC